jgi:hypothetical protein
LDFELKWKAKIRSSIKDICSFVEKEKDIRHIIFGGYDRTIRNIYDYEWGQKPILEVPHYIESKIQVIEMPDKSTKELEVAPINLREHIIKTFEKRSVFSSLDFLIKELLEIGYSRDQVEEELEHMKSENLIHQRKTERLVWSFITEEIIEEQSLTKQPEIIEDVVVLKKTESIVKSERVEETPAETTLKDIIIEFLKEKGLITSKPNFVNRIVEKGFAKGDVEKEIDRLKTQGMIQYSRSAPRGWSISTGESPIISTSPVKPSKIAVTSQAPVELEEKMLSFLKEKKIVGTKGEFINSIVSMGFAKQIIEKKIEELKLSNIIKYSRSAPRGWSLVS